MKAWTGDIQIDTIDGNRISLEKELIKMQENIASQKEKLFQVRIFMAFLYVMLMVLTWTINFV